MTYNDTHTYYEALYDAEIGGYIYDFLTTEKIHTTENFKAYLINHKIRFLKSQLQHTNLILVNNQFFHTLSIDKLTRTEFQSFILRYLNKPNPPEKITTTKLLLTLLSELF